MVCIDIHVAGKMAGLAWFQTLVTRFSPVRHDDLPSLSQPSLDYADTDYYLITFVFVRSVEIANQSLLQPLCPFDDRHESSLSRLLGADRGFPHEPRKTSARAYRLNSIARSRNASRSLLVEHITTDTDHWHKLPRRFSSTFRYSVATPSFHHCGIPLQT